MFFLILAPHCLFVCLFVSHGSGDPDMINGGGSGMINADLITDAEEKSSTANEL